MTFRSKRAEFKVARSEWAEVCVCLSRRLNVYICVRRIPCSSRTGIQTAVASHPIARSFRR